jgi:hypothetical protein
MVIDIGEAVKVAQGCRAAAIQKQRQKAPGGIYGGHFRRPGAKKYQPRGRHGNLWADFLAVFP